MTTTFKPGDTVTAYPKTDNPSESRYAWGNDLIVTGVDERTGIINTDGGPLRRDRKGFYGFGPSALALKAAPFKAGDVLVRITAGHAINGGDIVVVASVNHDARWLRTMEHGDWDFSSRAFRRLEEGETLRLSAEGHELYGGSPWGTPLAFEKVYPMGVAGPPLLCVHTADASGTQGAFRVSQLVASPEPEFPTEPEEGETITLTNWSGETRTIRASESDGADFFAHVTPSTVIRARNFADQFTRGREPGEFFDYLTENGYLTDQAYRDMSESLDEF